MKNDTYIEKYSTFQSYELRKIAIPLEMLTETNSYIQSLAQEFN